MARDPGVAANQLRLFSWQLFDEENPVHQSGTRYMFTTEGHIMSVDRHLRELPWKEFFPEDGGPAQEAATGPRPKAQELRVINSSANVSHGFWASQVRVQVEEVGR